MVKTLSAAAIKKVVYCFLTHSLTVFCLLAFPAIINAQTTPIINGTNWLLNNQNTDGSWSLGENKYLDTYTALETLINLAEEEFSIFQGISWLTAQKLQTADDLSSEIILLSMSGQDTSSGLNLLLSLLNTDGSWGLAQDYDSDNLDTALALQALNIINFADHDTIGFALSYLIDNQNTDGGFGFYLEDKSNVFMTSIVLKTFNSYKYAFLLGYEG